ncbi:ribosome maturation factor RimM [Bordetella avium]|uniref:Ribosome maturation factor RimM n=1 Tax=Bordetella avium (strain 197N) TaxID=360910 RepID=RIMM_BORA1|nr:ribosome maturation factor RimM [Bordetella avium]Q2KY81.1 RecName: Full=Ribosome maturation factor RimM [Bordetella avium 197N]AZY50953.1 ribosome maturation factor RimM [Bordetella avium]AZY54350.1 ribosome maturation factor RimM [Bordetella avium]RIQ12616.1 ribosome maturation factor RimM [Bordetella avium]RIQ17785.1 ribosome maturation factor RimM [Bordetella avium]RIQ32444.1 ribosome maturation factor RimM [Bordetella avium]
MSERTLPDDLVELGRVASAYGVKGWIKVQPHSAQADVLRAAKQWWLAATPKSAPRVYAVQQCRVHGATAVAQLEGIADRDQAEALRGATVWVSRALFPAAAEDEYYWIDLVGCAFYSSVSGSDVRVGVVEEVFDNPAHAILRVVCQDAEGKALLDAKGRAREMLVPFVSAHIQAVDIAARRIDSDWPLED